MPGFCNFQAPELGIGSRKGSNISFKNLFLRQFQVMLVWISFIEMLTLSVCLWFPILLSPARI